MKFRPYVIALCVGLFACSADQAPLIAEEQLLADRGIVMVDTEDPLCAAATLFDMQAFVVLAPGYHGDDALVQALQEHVRTLTAPYKYPRRIVFVSDLPKTVSGKIQRGVLRTRDTAH